MDTDRISIALTNYNRTDLLFESFSQVLNDDRISEVVISDDHSTDDIYQTILWKFNGVEKVKIFRNDVNLNCYKNKRRAVELSSNEWLVLLDSDNIITPAFIDSIFNQKWMTNPEYRHVIYQPDFAKPHFNFQALGGKLIDRTTVAGLINAGNCTTMLNAMNYFVNRDEYLKVWDGGIPDISTADSIYQNYCWIKAGNSIYVVQGMEYEHRVHGGSHYKQYVNSDSQHLNDDIINKLKAMR